jgi:MOSC domain-containing protein YiiM
MKATPLPAGVKLEQIFLSPGHNFFGHHGREPDDHPLLAVGSVKCLAGRGLEGDRFLDYKTDYSGQVTFFDLAVYDELCRATGVFDKSPGVLRRNLFVRGADLNALIGESFTFQDVAFSGSKECSPCYWMDRAFGPGAEAFLRNRGGLRARILTSGILRVDKDAGA